MQIVNKPIEDIKPYENNPRDNTKAVPYVAESIKQYGFKVPIIIDRGGTIVAGHTRYLASIELGLKEVPCIVADDLTDQQIKEFRLVDNKVAEYATWDIELLEIELNELDFDAEAFGFEIQQLAPAELIEDNYDADQADARCKLGDLWQLGRHRLICGDSTDVNVIDRLMRGQTADMVYTDPPYGMGLNTDFSDMHSRLNTDFANRGMKSTNYRAGKVDEFTPDMVNAIFSIGAKETFMFGADYYAELIPNRNEGSWIVWDKRANETDLLDDNDIALDRGYGSCFELCYSKQKHKRLIARVKWSGLFGMEHEFDRKRCHPTQKPVRLAQWFIERYSDKGASIVDIFGGSGSTLLACEQLDRTCYMCELDEHYCDVIIDRYEKFTGDKAVLVNE